MTFAAVRAPTRYLHRSGGSGATVAAQATPDAPIMASPCRGGPEPTPPDRAYNLEPMISAMPTLQALLLTATHLVLASIVTVHVLSHKRDPRSAVAWIGLAWLSPVVGSLLYVLLGINRVRSRARSLRGSERLREALGDDPTPLVNYGLHAVETAGSRITRRHVEAGNQVRILRNGDEAYPRMLQAIGRARDTIALSSYLFRADDAGRPFIDALGAARDRGVEVRVLVDGVGSGYFRSGTYIALRRLGVPVARFLHSLAPWRMPFINLRNHRKLLIVDGGLAYTGGLNIGAENLVRTRPRHPVLDKHFEISGPVVAQLCDAFSEDWRFATGEALTGPGWFPVLGACGETRARTVTSGPDQDLEKIELLIMEAVGCARKSVRIMTPYFLPDERLTVALSLAALRGAQVDIVLPERSNHPWLDWANRAHVEPLLTAGCNVWTHPAPFDHSKLLAIDGQWCLIGSANWDTRSFTLNFEINVEFYDTGLAGEIDAIVADHRTAALTLAALRQRSAARRLRDSAARLLSPYL